MQVGEPGGPKVISEAFARAQQQTAGATSPNFRASIKGKATEVFHKLSDISFADVKASFMSRFTKVKSFFTGLPEKFPATKKFISEEFANLKSKFTAENLKATKDKIIAGIKGKFTSEKFTAIKDKVVAGFKDIPKKAAELRSKISNKIFNEAIKQKFASINWKSAGIKGAIVAGALLALYAGVKVVKAIFGKNNA